MTDFVQRKTQFKNTLSIDEKNALLGCLIGDAVGAPWEMADEKNGLSGRAYILANKDLVVTGFGSRAPGHDENYFPGGYTDDFEMTLGTFLARYENEKVTQANLIQSWKEVWEHNCLINRFTYGSLNKAQATRCGYGSIIRVFTSKNEEEFQLNLIKNLKSQAKKQPGNANLMRQIPLVFNLKNKNDDILANVLATHPNPIAVFSSLILGDIANMILNCHQVDLKFLISSSIDRMSQYFKKNQQKISQQSSYYNSENYLEVHDKMLSKIQEILNYSKIPQGDDWLQKVENINLIFESIVAPYAKPLNGGIGLSAKSEQTLYCTIWLLLNLKSTDLWGNLKRCLSIGGDVDTLASIVMSIAVPFFEKKIPEKGLQTLPEWVLRDIEKPSLIDLF